MRWVKDEDVIHLLQKAAEELPVPVKEVSQPLLGKELHLSQPFCGDD